jgi:deoxyribodipyrimidine photo-lyase
MIVGSFLVKNLLINWRDGERGFWDCLLDADLASNSASWQWVAGCGADAAPYFRIFNPVTQSRKFVPNAEYIKKYVPELRNVPNKLIHEPWTMSIAEQAMYNVKIGKDYPDPVIDIKSSREFALMAYAHVRNTISIDIAD